jgi:CheY-like chemotaxis protein
VNNIAQMKENTRQLNILVVEDNKVFHAMYKKLLSEYFNSYTVAMDGLAGLKLYEENPSKYDIIISDHQMPKMDGLEMITGIRNINPDAHIIFITGTSEIEILTEVSHLSIDAIISKPLNKVQLLAKIDDIAAKIIDKRHMMEYIAQLEDMNQAIWTFKDRLRKKLKPLQNIPAAQKIYEDLEVFINKPISLVAADSDDEEEVSTQHLLESLTSEVVDEEFDVEEAMRNYGEDVAITADTVSYLDTSAKEEEPEGRFKDIRYTVVDKISAVDFVSEIDEGTFADLDDFRDDLDNFNLLLNDMSLCEPSHFYGYLDQVAEFYHRLFKTISAFVVFPAVENTFKEFANFISGITREQLEDLDKQNMLVDALFALSDDLSKWINIVFYEKDTDNIHYFDASFANTCLEIEAMFNEEEAQAAEDDEELLEFF